MRPRNQTARNQLEAILGRHPACSARTLADSLGVSIATLHRLFKELPDKVISAGKAGRARYALRRSLRGDFSPLPLFAIDRTGRAEQVGQLALLAPEGSWLDLAQMGWPTDEASCDGWWQGLPYPIYDMCPQGYIGRQFARAEHQQLAVAGDPRAWDDAAIVYILSQRGSDTTGNLLLGEPAYARWLKSKLAPEAPLIEQHIGPTYLARADAAARGGNAGSSAAGEFPKFTALRELAGSSTPHVLVKFSGGDGSPAVERWADLLVCEHLALECAQGLPEITSARSRIVQFGGRTFLEVERFDRHGQFGRSALCSLSALDAALIGGGSDWTVLATALKAARLISGEVQTRIHTLWWFGRLIGNTDMHTGNLSLIPGAQLALAPIYDMLPMMYAPLPGGEVTTPQFEVPLPLPAQRSIWLAAGHAAQAFWEMAANDGRISASFRVYCAENQRRLAHAMDIV